MLWNAKDVAAYLRISIRTVYELARAGNIPAVKLGRQVRFDEEVIRAWIAAGGFRLSAGWKRM